jgi:hypothetical protein
MFTKGESNLAIDSVLAVEGKFSWHPGIDTRPNVEIVMMYANKNTNHTYGTCPAKTAVFSEETMKVFKEFLSKAEEDFGKLAFEGGELRPYGPALGLDSRAESGTGLRGLGQG